MVDPAFDWAAIPTWRFCRDGSVASGVRYAVKIVPAVEATFVGVKQTDGPLVVRTLINSSQRLVGYSFTFLKEPVVKDFGSSLAASYGAVDSNEMLLVLGSPHLRILRLGTARPVFHIALRHR